MFRFFVVIFCKQVSSFHLPQFLRLSFGLKDFLIHNATHVAIQSMIQSQVLFMSVTQTFVCSRHLGTCNRSNGCCSVGLPGSGARAEKSYKI